jgi:hypothetical protein
MDIASTVYRVWGTWFLDLVCEICIILLYRDAALPCAEELDPKKVLKMELGSSEKLSDSCGSHGTNWDGITLRSLKDV